ncbi:bifunctional diaminohydroxyphosphoribosylaminopyrimidine deaminase/5-amino-6-(5-phosphoribosylamino)uracil reductase RibD [Aerococcus agrisoli]|uniref:Riboflavin biosynthesis protein RibD n=1 Tax=Aerococcus agrisoli TaxID=2487350 RepID=A0A3N4G9E4_9LACT|nr:bifunctional diaminohydroxyphosphoribosylaminopyrimidine deaminase/5-amino-6-(5-phosphoribosylamino)uracil reductase RibD [Aerococcus agrisoli]RPA57967.1 bifunctional diaminohydroxyphosphoribosylaminopyrimidine deaminase/5-amino-6-(5-phosphoribosylamino)uracil reductase RibD [Aerococcus agrisoli]
MTNETDEYYMGLALALAKKGRGHVAPNPMVGAVIVKDGHIIGQGYHEQYGQGHAEVNAFRSASEDVTGATIYVTLEPCSHYGKTPPCADLIIEKKVKRVVVGALDPNPLVAGRGIQKIADAGIEVTTGVLADESRQLNEVFMKFITTKQPFVVLKTAMSLDGKIATATGESQWISGEASRKQVHAERGYLTGILVGINTVLKDNPRLTARLPNSKNPTRIVVDSSLRIPFDRHILQDQDEAPTIIVTTDKADPDKIASLTERGIRVIVVASYQARVDLQAAMAELGALNIDSILLEGGAELNYAALAAGIVDKVQFYIAPKLIGGASAPTPVAGAGIAHLADALPITNMRTQMIGEDIFVEGYIKREVV